MKAHLKKHTEHFSKQGVDGHEQWMPYYTALELLALEILDSVEGSRG